MSRILKIAAALLGSAAAAEVAGSAYLYRRTMIRYNAKTERTMKMSGVDLGEIHSHDEGTQGVDDGTAPRGCVDHLP